MKIIEIIELLIEKQSEIDTIVDDMLELDIGTDAYMRYITGYTTNREVLDDITKLRFDSGLIVKAISALEDVVYTEPRDKVEG